MTSETCSFSGLVGDELSCIVGLSLHPLVTLLRYVHLSVVMVTLLYGHLGLMHDRRMLMMIFACQSFLNFLFCFCFFQIVCAGIRGYVCLYICI